MHTYVVLAGEISMHDGTPKAVQPAIDFNALRQVSDRVGLAIRIGPYSGPFSEKDAIIRMAIEVATRRVAEARQHGIEPVECQIDFDCAESKLNGYAHWLTAFTSALKPLPVAPTVLPSWMKRREFTSLVRTTGHFVLQVHSVAPPRTISDTVKLTDPQRAIDWVEKAASAGVPFRVALPTYTYLVAFDQTGKPCGISAEGPSSTWPRAAKIVRWEADPADIASLVARWQKDRPALLQGVIWYRLPVATDTLNWRWKTLASVIEGRSPASHLKIQAEGEQPYDIVLLNDGERDEPLPTTVEALWTGPNLLAADGLQGYQLEVFTPTMPPSAHGICLRLSEYATLSRLPPGARRNIGWIRCENPVEIQLSIPDSARSRAGQLDDSGSSANSSDRL